MERLKKERQELGVEDTPVGTEGGEEEEEGRRAIAEAESTGEAGSRASRQRPSAADDPYAVMNQSLHMDLPGAQGATTAEDSPARGRAGPGTPDEDQDDSLLGAEPRADRGPQYRNPFEGE